MITTLYNLALLQDLSNLINPSGAVCLKDFETYGIKEKNTHDHLHELKEKGFIRVTKVEYPHGMKRFYYKLTTKGKKEVGLKLSFWESLFCL